MRKALQIFNILTFIGTIVVNALANALPINGYTTGQLSEMYPNLFVPAGLTFSIWGLIYLLLTGFVIFQAQGLFGSTRTPPETERIGWLFAITNVINMSWILVWHHRLVALSIVLMLLFLFTLIVLYLRLQNLKTARNTAALWFVHIPFSVYLGWISIATIANFTTLFVHLGWSGAGVSEVSWASIMISVGTLLALFMLFRRDDWAYALVAIWAFVGILIKQSGAVPPVALTATIALGVLTIGLIYAAIRGQLRMR